MPVPIETFYLDHSSRQSNTFITTGAQVEECLREEFFNQIPTCVVANSVEPQSAPLIIGIESLDWTACYLLAKLRTPLQG